jgi:hypothetical protein
MSSPLLLPRVWCTSVAMAVQPGYWSWQRRPSAARRAALILRHCRVLPPAQPLLIAIP